MRNPSIPGGQHPFDKSTPNRTQPRAIAIERLEVFGNRVAQMPNHRQAASKTASKSKCNPGGGSPSSYTSLVRGSRATA